MGSLALRACSYHASSLLPRVHMRSFPFDILPHNASPVLSCQCTLTSPEGTHVVFDTLQGWQQRGESLDLGVREAWSQIPALEQTSRGTQTSHRTTLLRAMIRGAGGCCCEGCVKKWVPRGLGQGAMAPAQNSGKSLVGKNPGCEVRPTGAGSPV